MVVLAASCYSEAFYPLGTSMCTGLELRAVNDTWLVIGTSPGGSPVPVVHASDLDALAIDADSDD